MKACMYAAMTGRKHDAVCEPCWQAKQTNTMVFFSWGLSSLPPQDSRTISDLFPVLSGRVLREAVDAEHSWPLKQRTDKASSVICHLSSGHSLFSDISPPSLSISALFLLFSPLLSSPLLPRHTHTRAPAPQPPSLTLPLLTLSRVVQAGHCATAGAVDRSVSPSFRPH